MYSNSTANNYDCTPLLTSGKDGESDTNHIDPAIDNKSWFRRVFDGTPLLEKSQSGSDSDCQCNNCCGQQYGANGGYTCS
ncbi:unnamed protein product [Onchocerca ochengi]|uniref:Secreted protein n=1 Tax=Onchocerca ochengi TaxID=42157 RepID=A0A182EL28_ONCOC|nr:unnamed protein product [Onchocerca ochengi]